MIYHTAGAIEQMSDPHFLLRWSKTRLTSLHPRALQIQNNGIGQLANNARDKRIEVKPSRLYELESCDLLEGRRRVSLGVIRR